MLFLFHNHSRTPPLRSAAIDRRASKKSTTAISSSHAISAPRDIPPVFATVPRCRTLPELGAAAAVGRDTERWRVPEIASAEAAT